MAKTWRANLGQSRKSSKNEGKKKADGVQKHSLQLCKSPAVAVKCSQKRRNIRNTLKRAKTLFLKIFGQSESNVTRQRTKTVSVMGGGRGAVAESSKALLRRREN